ncbi:hypothetical protein ZWY2020_025767 [Hordeum vulgare]|nr:hypothetical protein ZWY2020_025767 [Hordeum vulgare]
MAPALQTSPSSQISPLLLPHGRLGIAPPAALWPAWTRSSLPWPRLHHGSTSPRPLLARRPVPPTAGSSAHHFTSPPLCQLHSRLACRVRTSAHQSLPDRPQGRNIGRHRLECNRSPFVSLRSTRMRARLP